LLITLDGPWWDEQTRYAASFSEVDDDLSQWRGYGKTGSRFNIGFRSEALRELANESGGKVKFVKIEYNERAALEAVHRSFIDRIDGYDANHADVKWHHNISAKFSVIGDLLDKSLHYKHGKFESEREWRLLSTWGFDPCFKLGRSFIVPYVVVELTKVESPIVSVTVGPCAHPNLSAASVKKLLNSRGWGKDVQVRQSCIPFQDW
jgi:hypothetical protein